MKYYIIYACSDGGPSEEIDKVFEESDARLIVKDKQHEARHHMRKEYWYEEFNDE